MKIIVLVLTLSFFPLFNSKAHSIPICSLDQDIKSLLLVRIFKYLYNNTNQDFDEEGKTPSKSCPVFIFPKEAASSSDYRGLVKGRQRFFCQLSLENKNYLIRLCREPNLKWQKIECDSDIWGTIYPLVDRDQCFKAKDQRMLIFSDSNPFYLRDHWSSIVKDLSLEFKIQPMGLVLYNKGLELVYF